MLRTIAALVLAGFVPGLCPMFSQDTAVQSKLLRGMSAEQMQALRESRIEAQKEISRGQSPP